MRHVKIYRQSLAAILLLAMLGQTFNQGLYYLDYIVNRSAFEKNCINKAKKWMHCDGKCQLMKKIVESEKQQQQQPEMKLASKTEIISSPSFDADLPPVPVTFVTHQYNSINTGEPVDQSYSIFHPPTV